MEYNYTSFSCIYFEVSSLDTYGMKGFLMYFITIL